MLEPPAAQRRERQRQQPVGADCLAMRSSPLLLRWGVRGVPNPIRQPVETIRPSRLQLDAGDDDPPCRAGLGDAGWSARSPSWGAGSGRGRSPRWARAHPCLSEPGRQAARVHRARQDRGVLAGVASAIIVLVGRSAAPGPTPLGRPRSPPPRTNRRAQALRGSGPDVQVVSKPGGTISTRRMNCGFHADLWPSVSLAGYAWFL